MNIDYNHYINLIEQRRFQAGVDYKNSFVPTSLHKYYGLTNDLKINEEKLKCLGNAQIYLPDYENVNDPFEFQALYLNRSRLEEKKWPYEELMSIWTNIRKGIRFTCLANTDENNLPMWAYYANNHEGFCIHYEFDDLSKKNIFPIEYTTERFDGSALLADNIRYCFEQMQNPKENEANIAIMMMFLSLSLKHISWGHEKEFRLFEFNMKTYFPAHPATIYIGKDCRVQYKDRLIKIGEELGIAVYQMYFDSQGTDYGLSKSLLYYPHR